jgi:hypothetical protein
MMEIKAWHCTVDGGSDRAALLVYEETSFKDLRWVAIRDLPMLRFRCGTLI